MPTKTCRLCMNKKPVFEIWKTALLDNQQFKTEISLQCFSHLNGLFYYSSNRSSLSQKI